MNTMTTDESCAENKQSVTPSGSLISEGSYGFSRVSAAGSIPAISSPSHRRMTGPIRRTKGGWTPEEDETLKHAVGLHRGRSWKQIGFPEIRRKLNNKRFPTWAFICLFGEKLPMLNLCQNAFATFFIIWLMNYIVSLLRM